MEIRRLGDVSWRDTKGPYWVSPRSVWLKDKPFRSDRWLRGSVDEWREAHKDLLVTHDEADAIAEFFWEASEGNDIEPRI